MPIFTLLDENQGDISEADLAALDVDQDVIGDVERLVSIYKQIKPLLDQQELDVANPDVAKAADLSIAIGVSLDMMQKADGAAATAAAESDVLDDAAKIVGIAGGVAALFSDQRLKYDIVPRGKSPNGVSIFDFSYIGSPDRFQGVIAQDVMRSRPEAIFLSRSGYLMVDYSQLDVSFVRLSH